MALIFLSYRRGDSPQACRIFDWLTRRFGADAVFMDVSSIPFATAFPEFIRDAIVNSRTLIALIGPGWPDRMKEPRDPVRMELETALNAGVPVLPLLIGNTPMPQPSELPETLAAISDQNAFVVGVSRDFDSHMRAFQPCVESILGALATDGVVTSDAHVVQRVCDGLLHFLAHRYRSEVPESDTQWVLVNAVSLRALDGMMGASLFLHRVTRLAELLELHFILSFWAGSASSENLLAGWVMRELERTPCIPGEHFWLSSENPLWDVKIRRSDEDAREVWKMITNQPLRLSLSYIATVSPKSA
jgi:hypothetical protein